MNYNHNHNHNHNHENKGKESKILLQRDPADTTAGPIKDVSHHLIHKALVDILGSCYRKPLVRRAMISKLNGRYGYKSTQLFEEIGLAILKMAEGDDTPREY
jgi:hypothetical protein